MAASYAENADFEDYVEGWVTDDDAALTRLLERASRDIDQIFGRISIEPNGLKYGEASTTNEKELEDWQVAALIRATCAQAEYRNLMGEEFFARYQFDEVKGPEFATKGRAPYIGPKVARELSDTGLMARPSTSVKVRRYDDRGQRIVPERRFSIG